VLVNRLDQLEPVTEMGLLLIDLNDFKDINDSHGHGVGDTVLREVADRLVGCGDPNLALRLGGDEFAMMVPGAAHQTEAIADMVLQRVAEPITVGGTDVRTSGSIGMAHTSTAGPHELLRFADVAMFTAKRSGTGRAWYSATDDRGASPDARRARRDWRGRTAPH
jgi:diguanylate cyclase (GGDEF)-like protein